LKEGVPGFVGDLLQIIDFAVIASKPDGVVPYPAGTRGVIVLACRSSVDADQ
jgi:hypothetical protein